MADSVLCFFFVGDFERLWAYKAWSFESRGFEFGAWGSLDPDTLCS